LLDFGFLELVLALYHHDELSRICHRALFMPNECRGKAASELHRYAAKPIQPVRNRTRDPNHAQGQHPTLTWLMQWDKYAPNGGLTNEA
jgi:hypothetical protein